MDFGAGAGAVGAMGNPGVVDVMSWCVSTVHRCTCLALNLALLTRNLLGFQVYGDPRNITAVSDGSLLDNRSMCSGHYQSVFALFQLELGL